MYIGGEFKEKKEKIDIIDPATGKPFSSISQADEDDLDFCLQTARSAQRTWQQTSAKERKGLLLEIAEAIYDNQKKLAELETKEIGKPIKETLFVDIPMAAECFKYYASLLDVISSDISFNKDKIDMIQYMPLGVAGLFLPYNVPMMIFGFNAASAIAAGNAVIVKPSEFGSLSLLELAKYLDELDFPKGLISIITGEGAVIGKKLAESDIDVISYTGSSENFEKMYHNIKRPKKIICELSGINLAVVYSDANLEEALENIVASAFMKQGQICIGTSICLIEEDIYDKFKEILIKKTKTIQVGDPFSPLTGMGPIRTEEHLEKIIEQVARLKDNGRILSGGNRLDMEGYFYEPSLIEMDEVVYEECFDPVLMLNKFKKNEIKEIIENNPTGLSMQIWTGDMDLAKDLADESRCGTVWINTFAQMDGSTPFGGFKQSGWGRVLGKWGFYEYLQPKHIGISYKKSQVSGWF